MWYALLVRQRIKSTRSFRNNYHLSPNNTICLHRLDKVLFKLHCCKETVAEKLFNLATLQNCNITDMKQARKILRGYIFQGITENYGTVIVSNQIFWSIVQKNPCDLRSVTQVFFTFNKHEQETLVYWWKCYCDNILLVRGYGKKIHSVCIFFISSNRKGK